MIKTKQKLHLTLTLKWKQASRRRRKISTNYANKKNKQKKIDNVCVKPTLWRVFHERRKAS